MLGRLVYWLLCLLLVIVLVATAAAVVMIRRSFPDQQGTSTVSGLHGGVRVLRDNYGVPQVYAGDAHDLFFAQGFVQAQDRFWEMDFRRHLAAGRLSELFGAGQVETDTYLRTMGWHRVAERELSLLDPRTRDYLSAYAAGVNAYLHTRHGSALSLEYTLLSLQNPHYRIAPWTPADSLSWLKVMAWQLRGNDDQERLRALLATRFSPARVAELFPPYDDRAAPPIVSGGKVVHGRFVPTDGRPPLRGDRIPPGTRGALRHAGARASLTRADDALDAIGAVAGKGGDGIGSNAWAVAGSRTATGKPILANDPHLGPAMPSIWYQMGLHCAPVGAACPFDVAGSTFSGLPGVIIGHNARIAWGFTNLGPDVADLYLEQVRGDRYLYRGKWLPLSVRKETIRVAGGKPVPIEVRATRHGPLLSDASGDLRGVGKDAPVDGASHPAHASYAVAMRWTALTPGRTADAIFALDAAGDFTGFRAAARLFAVPAQNLVYADVDGHIGYQAPGQIPIRRGYDGDWPAVGWTGRDEWTGYVPFDALPYSFDPEQGYVVTANQEAVGGAYPYHLTDDWDYGYRSRRIAGLITSSARPITVAATHRMQLDTSNDAARMLVPYLRRLHPPAGAERAWRLLAGWDYSMPADSAAAAYFNSVWKHVLMRTFDDLPKAARPDGGSRWFAVIGNLLTQPTSPWWDDPATRHVRETRGDVLTEAMGDAYDELSRRLGADPTRWRWGDLHTLTVQNQSFGTSGVAPIEWLFNRGPLRLSGGLSVVDATGWYVGQGYEVRWVPSMRMIVDLGDLDRSRWVNLTGASGHAFDPHYFDQARIWETGTTPMRWGQGSIDRGTIYTLVLRPAG
jgi:penicillin G amidase